MSKLAKAEDTWSGKIRRGKDNLALPDVCEANCPNSRAPEKHMSCVGIIDKRFLLDSLGRCRTSINNDGVDVGVMWGYHNLLVVVSLQVCLVIPTCAFLPSLQHAKDQYVNVTRPKYRSSTWRVDASDRR